MLTLICGLPRAGKTTYSMRYDGTREVLHLDQRGYVRTQKKVRALGDVVVEGTYNDAYQRIALVQAYTGDFKECIWLDTPIEIKKTREGYSQCCELPFEPPTYDEGWDNIIVIKGDAHG